MPKHTLVLGGIHSGKSSYAEALINGSKDVQFIATAVYNPKDENFAKRVAQHRARRPRHWRTVEATHGLAAAVRQATSPVLVDDIGGWMAAMLDHARWSGEISVYADEFLEALRMCQHDVIIVSPEVGLSVVPTTSAGNRFADELGLLNQKLAQLCEEVVMVVAGIPLPIKRAK